MSNLFSWMKSTRSIAVVLIVIGVVIGLFVGKIDQTTFKEVAMVIVTAYFVRQVSASETGNSITSETTTTTETNNK